MKVCSDRLDAYFVNCYKSTGRAIVLLSTSVFALAMVAVLLL